MFLNPFLDQWSLLNQTGKKKYDRDFLLQLQFESVSLLKPANLPKVQELLLDMVGNNWSNIVDSNTL